MTSHQDAPAINRRTRSLRQFYAKLLILAVSVVVAALLGEAIVRIAMPGYPGFRIPQVEHRPMPGLGFEMIPNQTAYSWASRVTINSSGYRGAERRSPPGSPLILCLGDSMTMGVGVEDDETFVSQLERLVAREWPDASPETVNMGVQRYFTYQEIDVLKRQLVRDKPDVVTLAVYVNDLGVRPPDDHVREFENERERAATSFRNVLPSVYLLVKNLAMVELAKNVYLATTESPDNIAAHALSGRIEPRHEPRWQGVERELDTFAELASEHGFHPIVVFVPVRSQVKGDFPDSVYPKRLLDYSRTIGLPTVDPLAEFQRSLRSGQDPYLAWDDHLSITGHEIIAEAILDAMRRRSPLWSS